MRLAKYGQLDWSFEPGYPLIDRIILYEQKMEIITGKVAADQITAFSYQIAGIKPDLLVTFLYGLKRHPPEGESF